MRHVLHTAMRGLFAIRTADGNLMDIREDFQRARSEQQKAARRQEILDAAEGLLLEAGIRAFTVSAVAARAGVSKSTIFLYFTNKEDLLLEIYTRAFCMIMERVSQSLVPGMSGRAFCETFIDCALAHPAMLVLRSQLAHLIERKVTKDRMIFSKQEILHCGLAVAAQIEQVLALEDGKGLRILMTLINLMAGANQADAQAYVDLDTMPEGLSKLIRVADTRTVFLSGAEFVFCGATGRPFD